MNFVWFYNNVKVENEMVGVKHETSVTEYECKNFVDFYRRIQLDENGNIKVVFK
jgi:hypothetical protein